jgi:hypothetical protein
VGGKSYTRYDFEDKAKLPTGGIGSRNLAAKFAVMAAWMNDTCAETDFSLHKRTVMLAARLFEEVLSRRRERFNL